MGVTHADPSGAADLLTLGIALLVIYSALACALSRILLARKADEGRRWKRAMEAGVRVAPYVTVADEGDEPCEFCGRTLADGPCDSCAEDDDEADAHHDAIVIPPERRTRYAPDVNPDWIAASPEERSEAVLDALRRPSTSSK